MPGQKFLQNVNGTATEVRGVQTGGSGNAGDIVALDDTTGLLDITMMPVGIGPDTATITASEAITAGSFVNVWNNSGVFNVRNADATNTGKRADGFVLASVSLSGAALVYFGGTNNALTGLTPGEIWLSVTTPGGVQGTAPTGAPQLVQRLGVATSSTTANIVIVNPIVTAT